MLYVHVMVYSETINECANVNDGHGWVDNSRSKEKHQDGRKFRMMRESVLAKSTWEINKFRVRIAEKTETSTKFWREKWLFEIVERTRKWKWFKANKEWTMQKLSGNENLTRLLPNVTQKDKSK